MSQQALSDFCHIGRMQVSQVVRRLHEKRLLVRSRDPEDARARRLRLTPEGSERLAEALERVEREDVAFCSASSRPEHLRALLAML